VGRYDGFEEFVAAQGRALSRTAYFLAGDAAGAEDLLQEALAATARHWPRVRADNPTAYVRQVMLNRTRSAWTRAHQARDRSLEPWLEQPAADPSSEVSDMVALAHVLRRLAPRQRAVLYLRFYEDLSVDETARLLGCSPGTVKSQTSDALARLRTLAPELFPTRPAR
jgi:RNA polymerase sigma-70 factor (sigma-E family)